jgi:hypothetical protein
MLLSMFISFLLARRFRGKVYVLLMTMVLILVSLFSIGFPIIWRSIDGDIIWQMNSATIPLSFPFHASISEIPYADLLPYYPRPLHPLAYDVELYFLTFQLVDFESIVITRHIIFLVSFFLPVNLVGAILGYWINKSTFIDKLLKKDKANHVV